MKISEVEQALKDIEELLRDDSALSSVAEEAIRKLFNLVEALCGDVQSLNGEVDRLKKLLEEKKRGKNAPSDSSSRDNSSEQRRPPDPSKEPPKLRDRRSGKDLEIHETIPCPVDPSILPPDAIRVQDQSIVVQDIIIKPRNIEFRQEVYYSHKERKLYRGALPSGYQTSDFGPDLRALILSLKYSGNMSEPKIGEFLENFGVEVSSGSLSNILTRTAQDFEDAYRDVWVAGLTSTTYQQTDDTSARVAGKFWHTHIICNPYYTFYSTRPGKDRVNVLAALQNTASLHHRLNQKTLKMLGNEFKICGKWQVKVRELIENNSGSIDLDEEKFNLLLNEWMGKTCAADRLAICHASAIVYYREQTIVPVVQLLVSDDAPQFKFVTEHQALCWIHEARHYEKLTPVVPSHREAKENFLKRYWEYYGWLQSYRESPTAARADELRAEFTKLFTIVTQYDALDYRIKITGAKQKELLKVLEYPNCPLHNNASELGARVSARRRDVSLHSVSKRGAHSMDVFTTLTQTCKKLFISAYEYFRLHLLKDPTAPHLGKLIQAAAANTPTPSLC